MDTFSALAVEKRRNIIEILADAGRLSVAEICEKFSITPSAISQHLKVLREANLVQVEKQGQQRIYEINTEALRELEGWAAHVSQRFELLDEVLEREKQKLNAEKIKTSVVAEPNKQEIVITREFNAPRELVFKAFTDRELYVQWLGPRGYTMTLKTFEPKDGGSYRYIHKDNDGNEYGFYGVFHEVTAPERIIQTFEFEGLPERGHVSLETAEFEALPGDRTKVTMLSVFQSVADRDGLIQSGMESGLNEGFERLDELLQKLQK